MPRLTQALWAAPLLGVLMGLPFLLACEGCECGYGGPGCGAPMLRGACAGALVLETPTEVTITYFDDTGRHEADVTTLTSDPAALDVARVPGATGRFVLTAHREGTAMLTAEIDGWTDTQGFTLDGVTSPRCSDATTADGGCGCAAVEGYPLTR